MLDVTAAAKPTAPKAITIKHLAFELAEQLQLGKAHISHDARRSHQNDHRAPERKASA